ncbi:hypothetical protein TorRG33x02_184700, partial [Trema orientale]
ELRLAALRDRLADADKLRLRYQRQVDVLSAESYRSGWENREFEGHPEVVTPDQFDLQKGVERDSYSVGYYMQQMGDAINIEYPADVLKMLDIERDGPSTSAATGTELVPIISPSEPTEDLSEVAAAVDVSSDDSELVAPPRAADGSSAETGIPPFGGGN